MEAEIGPAGPRALAVRLRALAAVAPVFGVFAVVIIGIYGGWANPTEAAAIGAAACGVLAVVSGGMRWRGLLDTALGTAQSTAMIFLVLLGADQLNTALAVSQMPAELAAVGEGQRPAAAAGDGGDPGRLHPARLRDGQPGDDPADHSGVLPGGDGAGFLAWATPTRASGSASWR